MFGDILRELREDRGYTQEELGKKLHLSKTSISHYENSLSMPNIDLLIMLSDIFDVSVDYLLGQTDVTVKYSDFSKTMFRDYTLGSAVNIISSLDKNHLESFFTFLDYIKLHNDIANVKQ
ncbi:MAG: helix-turn-helix domain-containing protein [Lachnospiraceae bacterium]